MHFGFAIDLSDIDLLDTELDMLDTDTPSKHFVCPQDVLKTSSRHIFKMSSRQVLKTSSICLEHSKFSTFKTSLSLRRLQDDFRDVCKAT